MLRADGSEAFAYRRIGNGNDDHPEREPFSETWMAVSQTLSPGTYRAECVIHGTKVVSAAQLEVSS